MQFKWSIQVLSTVLNKVVFNLLIVWVSLSSVINIIKPKLLGLNHFKIQTIPLPMTFKDKPKLACVFKTLNTRDELEKKKGQIAFT